MSTYHDAVYGVVLKPEGSGPYNRDESLVMSYSPKRSDSSERVSIVRTSTCREW